jgi:solute carrier family 5 (high affinity choline transporter), member 7
VAIVAITLLYAGFFVIGWSASRRMRGGTATDFIVAGRAMPLWLATLTMTATWVDGGYLLGTAEGAYRSSIVSGLQGGVCFGVSLILGGLFFARRMRALGFHTLIDPFEARFGARWAAVLSVPALLAEVFWSAELLVALGSTFGVVIGFDLATAIIGSAAVVTIYTMVGGMWSVAYTDAVQLGLVVLGLAVALPAALDAVGGFGAAWTQYQVSRPESPFVTRASTIAWVDVSAMLVLGGIPWNCYFQRVLSCRSPRSAQWHSILSGLLTIGLTVPPLIFGLVAVAYPWPREMVAQLDAQPADALPLILKYAVPPIVSLFGIAAIVGAVTSSFSASILSASSMFSWNTYRRLFRPHTPQVNLKPVLRTSIVALGVGATLLALTVQSVQALWFLTSDLVFVLLFPQLVAALFDPKANLAGSCTAFVVSLAIRLGGGEPLFGFQALVDYPELFPFRIAAAAAGMLLLPLVSRWTRDWSPPRPLRNGAQESQVTL